MAPERKGGPTDPLTHFSFIIESLFINNFKSPQYQKAEDYPMYEFLAQFSTKPEARALAQKRIKAL